MAEDRFSKQASAYAQFRPEYPQQLFEFLAQLAPARDVAWDCGTGTGQAARSLSPYFKQVLATDLSAEQIAHAHAPKNVNFQIVQAEKLIVPDSTFDLITVAQALHWFDLPSFFGLVQRALKPKGLIAAWGYGFFKITEQVDGILDSYGREFLQKYWSTKNMLLINSYRDLPFPFERIEAPPFELKAQWSLARLKGYLNSWSATQKYKDEIGRDPFETIRAKVESCWGTPTTLRDVTWRLHILLGRNSV